MTAAIISIGIPLVTALLGGVWTTAIKMGRVESMVAEIQRDNSTFGKQLADHERRITFLEVK